MSTRTRKGAERIRLMKLCESNNSLSPDILTAVTTAGSDMDAWRIAVIFEEVTEEDLPFDLEDWRRSVRIPVELYFVFKRKKDRGRFVRMMSREFPETEVII